MSGVGSGVRPLGIRYPIGAPVVVRSTDGDRWVGILEAISDGVAQLRGVRKVAVGGYQVPDADLAIIGVQERWGEESKAGRLVPRQWVRGWTEIVPMSAEAYRTVDASWVPAVPS